MPISFVRNNVEKRKKHVRSAFIRSLKEVSKIRQRCKKKMNSINLNNIINENTEHDVKISEIVAEQCSKFFEYLVVQTQERINDHKPDMHQEFFNSLLPIVGKFNDDQTLIFRTEIIKVAHKLLKKINHLVYHSKYHIVLYLQHLYNINHIFINFHTICTDLYIRTIRDIYFHSIRITIQP